MLPVENKTSIEKERHWLWTCKQCADCDW